MDINVDFMQRDCECASLNGGAVGREVTLNGWVHRRRDHGGIIFVNLRDRSGQLQCVIDADAPDELRQNAAHLKAEQCVAFRGRLRHRPDDMVNPDMATGEVELVISRIELLNQSETPPFVISDGESEASESSRMRYRYLDLRSGAMQRRIAMRHQAMFAVRRHLVERNFYEIETPLFIRSTPEGARDFLVPARLYPGKFYALPQSPQLYKQLLMVSGFERYFQIARCFRDEDARGDRQPEFSQIDIEMSFCKQQDVIDMSERLTAELFKECLGIDLAMPFKRISYHEAMRRYGSDKPDTRFALELQDFSTLAHGCGFTLFENVLTEKGVIKLLTVPGAADRFSRKKVAELEKTACKYGAKGLAWCKVTADGLEGGIGKFLNGQADKIKSELNLNPGDILFFVADKWQIASVALGAVRTQLADELQLIKPGQFNFLWVVDFPLFERTDEGGWTAMHHIFSMPKVENMEQLETDPASVRGNLYDLVLNGNEVAGGSIRIHNRELQQRVLNVIGFSAEKAEQSFGFLLEALRYGAPPHGGIAYGFDRLMMLMAGCDSIKDVIAFPKNNTGVSLMDNAPQGVDLSQLQDLSISVKCPGGDR